MNTSDSSFRNLDCAAERSACSECSLIVKPGTSSQAPFRASLRWRDDPKQSTWADIAISDAARRASVDNLVRGSDCCARLPSNTRFGSYCWSRTQRHQKLNTEFPGHAKAEFDTVCGNFARVCESESESLPLHALPIPRQTNPPVANQILTAPVHVACGFNDTRAAQ